MATLANYMFGFSFSYHVLHLAGEEVFGSAKRLVDCPLGANNDYHCLDHVSFFRPRVIVLTTQPNVVGNIGMQQLPCGFSACLPLVFRGGLELKENICVDG
jgi:hypothetical protein